MNKINNLSDIVNNGLDTKKNEQPPIESSEKSKREDHPLFEVALNDFKGKLIK